MPEDRRVEGRGIEVGQIFFFGTKYSEPMKARGRQRGRRAGAGADGLARHRRLAARRRDHRGEPRRARASSGPRASRRSAPASSTSSQGDAAADAACEALYAGLTAAGLDPLYDDRDERAGAKFATMDLIGLPWRITVGPRGLAAGKVELTSRRTGESEELTPGGRRRAARARSTARSAEPRRRQSSRQAARLQLHRRCARAISASDGAISTTLTATPASPGELRHMERKLHGSPSTTA